MEQNNLEKKEKEYWGKSFYGSKLNTILLLVLIILMVVAINIMLKDKATYFSVFEQNNLNDNVSGMPENDESVLAPTVIENSNNGIDKLESNKVSFTISKAEVNKNTTTNRPGFSINYLKNYTAHPFFRDSCGTECSTPPHFSSVQFFIKSDKSNLVTTEIMYEGIPGDYGFNRNNVFTYLGTEIKGDRIYKKYQTTKEFHGDDRHYYYLTEVNPTTVMVIMHDASQGDAFAVDLASLVFSN